MNLSQLIQQRKKNNSPFTLQELVKNALDIVRGLEVLHGNSIIHRDLSTCYILSNLTIIESDNIFVTLNQTSDVDCLVIGDFDTAKLLTEETLAKTTIGTPGYMAPVRSSYLSLTYFSRKF
jgi:serine/threonine protein kinase